MNLCCNNHNEVCYEGGNCPVCDVIADKDCVIADKQDLIDAKQTEIDRLREEVTRLSDGQI